MRVLALGGCGDMGRVAVETALHFAFVDEVIVADLDGEKAEKLAAASGAKARAARVDVTDAAGLRKELAEADVVLNTVGPFYRFGVPILEAAIDSGCHYLDINDDWEPTLDMLALSPRAEEAGITAIVGMGASPGVSNLLAVQAMRGLDRVDEVLTCWSLGGAETELEGRDEEGKETGPSAAIVHWMHQCSGKIRVWRDGAFADVKPVVERPIDFPGVGRGRAWSVGHPEAVTLPLCFPEIRDCANLMAGPSALMRAVEQLRDAIDAGQLSVEQAAAMITGPVPDDMRQGDPDGRASSAALPPLFALASGERDGAPRRVGALILGAPDGGMGGITGIPLAVALALFESGSIHRRGVFAPEGAVDPDAFFEELAPYCHAPGDASPFRSREQLVLVTEGPSA